MIAHTIGQVPTHPDVPGADPRLRWPRLATLGYLAMSVLTSVPMPGIGDS